MADLPVKQLEGYMNISSELTTATPTAAYGSRPNSLLHCRKDDEIDVLGLTSGDFQNHRNTLQSSAKLRELRNNRKQIQEKFMRITTRMNFMKKKESESLKHAIQAKNKLHSVYIRKHIKMSEQQLKEQLDQKRRFEVWKKNQQLTKKLMIESVQNRKLKSIERQRDRRWSQRQEMNHRKDLSLFQRQHKHDAILNMHEKQAIKKKLMDMSKKLSCRDNLNNRIQQYQHEAAKAYEFIDNLKKKQIQLTRVNQQSSYIFKSIMDDFNRLKKS